MNVKPDGAEISRCVTGACVPGKGLGRPSGDVSYHAPDRVMQYCILLFQTLDEQHM